MFIVTAGLALFGAMMVYSASAMFALKESESISQFTYFYKQIGFTIGGLVAMFLVSKIDYHVLQEPYVVYSIMAATIILLLLVFGFQPINGATALDTVLRVLISAVRSCQDRTSYLFGLLPH